MGILKRFERINRTTVEPKIYQQFQVCYIVLSYNFLCIDQSNRNLSRINEKLPLKNGPIKRKIIYLLRRLLCFTLGNLWKAKWRGCRQALYCFGSLQVSTNKEDFDHFNCALDDYLSSFRRSREKRRNFGSWCFSYVHHCYCNWISCRYIPNPSIRRLGKKMACCWFLSGQWYFQFTSNHSSNR